MILKYDFTDPTGIKDGNYEIRTEHGRLLIASCPQWNHKDWRESLRKMKDLYAWIFEAATHANAETLFLPLLGEENEFTPAHRSVEALWDAACRSEFDGTCIVQIVNYGEATIRHPEFELTEGFSRIFFERPVSDLYMRISGHGIEPTDRLVQVEQGTHADAPFDPETDNKMEKGVFSDPVKTWQAAGTNSPELANSLFAAMHDLYYAHPAFLMNLCGVLPDGREIVVFRLLDSVTVSGNSIPQGRYEKGTYLISRLPEGCGSIEMTVPQIGKKAEITFFTNQSIRDRFEGCIIGGAAGDALGYPIEFKKYKEIQKEYGPDGIRTFECMADGVSDSWYEVFSTDKKEEKEPVEKKALISDDTQMTLFTMDGLRQGIVRAETKGNSAKPEVYIAWAYLDWLSTQRGTRKKWKKNSFTDLFREEPALDARRAPGNTCLASLEELLENSENPPYSAKIHTMEDPVNHSKGCGGVMRVAPVGLMLSSNHWIGKEGAAHTAGEAAAITHGHPLGYIPAAYLAELIHRITYRMDGNRSMKKIMERTLDVIDTHFSGDPYLHAFDEILQKAWKLADKENEASWVRYQSGAEDPGKSEKDVLNIHSIGGGWVGEEALAIALYCVRRYPNDWQKALRLAVNHSGDSDSTGSIAGNILGAYLGLKEMKRQAEKSAGDNICLEELELYDRMLMVSDAAFSVIDKTKRTFKKASDKRDELSYFLLGFSRIAAIDRKKMTAYVFHEDKKKWIEHKSLYSEMEWGSENGRKLVLMDGFDA